MTTCQHCGCGDDVVITKWGCSSKDCTGWDKVPDNDLPMPDFTNIDTATVMNILSVARAEFMCGYANFLCLAIRDNFRYNDVALEVQRRICCSLGGYGTLTDYLCDEDVPYMVCNRKALNNLRLRWIDKMVAGLEVSRG